MTPGPRPPVIVVTGASSGIGLALVRKLAARNAHLVLVARDRGALERAAREAVAAGAASAHPEPLDVGDDDSVGKLVVGVLERHGRIDAAAHLAAVVAYGRTEDVPVEVFDRVLRTNLSGSANLARHVVPVLRDQGRGHLVLTGSVLGHIAAPGMTPYVVSKWGVRALARQLQLENRDKPDVHVSYVAPGGVDTPIYQAAAHYWGFQGRPPPPVSSPERVADAVLGVLDRPRPRRQVGLANGLMRFGFSAAPGLYDALVGPLFGVLGVDRDRPVSPGPGNVLTALTALTAPSGTHALRSTLGSPIGAVARNLRATARRSPR